jgi:hypothetical protein
VINVNSIASHLSSKNTANDLAPLVQQLAKRADTNHDGTVTSAEFSDFLSKLVQSIDETPQAPATTPSSAVAGTAAAPATAVATQTPGAAAIRAIVAALSKER